MRRAKNNLTPAALKALYYLLFIATLSIVLTSGAVHMLVSEMNFAKNKN
jgi:hypothetical protein